jgi:hypothetical protein
VLVDPLSNVWSFFGTENVQSVQSFWLVEAVLHRGGSIPCKPMPEQEVSTPRRGGSHGVQRDCRWHHGAFCPVATVRHGASPLRCLSGRREGVHAHHLQVLQCRGSVEEKGIIGGIEQSSGIFG